MAGTGISNESVLITGGAGFIGCNLVETLCKKNKVYVVDNLHTGSIGNIKNVMETNGVRFFKEDSKRINSIRINDKPERIFHLGMYSASPMYRKDPALLGDVCASMIAVLEFARKNDSDVVFASTSSIYNGIRPPHREDITPMVTDFYTEGRIFCERVSELYNRLYGMNIAAMRFFSVYGWHEESKNGYANLITQFMWDFNRNKSPVVYGNGRQKRDFVFVDDVVEAMIKASNRNRGFDIYNVGTGRNYSINDMISKLRKYTGKNIKAKYVKMPVKNYVMETLADTRKAQKKLGFKAKVNLDQGIKMLLKGKKEE